jgi:predicted membrane channel-forming protein YqfA (hemolysin III family)
MSINKMLRLIRNTWIYYLVLVGCFLLAIYPYHPTGFLGWIFLVLASAPIVLFLEWLGSLILLRKSVTQMGSAQRIIVGIFAVSIIGCLLISVWHCIWPYMDRWGM